MNEKFKENIMGLLELAFEVDEKTDAYVSVDFSNYARVCAVYIMDEGFDPEKEYDLDCTIYDDMGTGKNELLFQKAENHLKSLLEKADVKEV